MRCVNNARQRSFFWFVAYCRNTDGWCPRKSFKWESSLALGDGFARNPRQSVVSADHPAGWARPQDVSWPLKRAESTGSLSDEHMIIVHSVAANCQW